MSLKACYPRKDRFLSKGTPFISSVPNCSALPLRMEETLSGFFFKVFICLALYSHSCRVMANTTLFDCNITGWAVLCILRNMSYDKDDKGKNLCKFPYQDGNVNHWFQQEVEGDTTRTIYMLNLRKWPRSKYYPRLDGAVFPPSVEEVQDGTMLYHGTLLKHANSILLEGIRLSASTTDGDFSCGYGFYVTNKFERAAADYAFSSHTEKAAVLCYKIPDDVLESFRERSKYLVGRENEEEWYTVVDDIRSFIDSNDELSFIEGPEMRRKENIKGDKTFQQLPNTYQMCILADDMADAFDKHLHSVVFYNTSREKEA